MSTEPVRIVSSVALATVGLVIALGIGPVSTSTIVSAYLLVLAAIAIGSLTRTLGGNPDLRVSTLAQALARRRTPPPRPPELVRVERELTLAISNSGHLHRRLAPMLRDVAEARLGGRLTRERLGDDAWKLLRPDREPPDDPLAPGASLPELRRVIARLEEL